MEGHIQQCISGGPRRLFHVWMRRGLGTGAAHAIQRHLPKPFEMNYELCAVC